VKTRKTRIVFPVFHNYTVCVVVTSDIAKAMSEYPHLRSCAEEGGEKDPCVFTSNSHRCYMFLPLHASVRTIAHECWHAIKAIFGFVDISLDHECVAYHLGYLTQKVYSFVHRKEKQR
jgi:hypothetical protein